MSVTKRGSGDKADTKLAAKPLYDASLITYEDGGWVPEVTQLRNSLPAYLLCTAVTMFLAITVCDYFDPVASLREFATHREYYFPTIAYSILGYYFFLLFSRWAESDSHVLYEQIWACNTAMSWTVVGMLTNRPLLTGMACAIVCVDQLMWYIDITVAIFTGFKKFPVGVARYIAWPETSLMKRITAGHHLWFLPIMLYSLDLELPHYSFVAGALILGTCLVTVSRFTTPFHCLILNSAPSTKLKVDGEETNHFPYRVLYLNINTCYAFWKDVKFDFLHVVDHRSPWLMIPFVTLAGNVTFNLVAYGLILQAIAFVKAL